MRLADHFPRAGDTLFRWRSYLPLALVPLFLVTFMAVSYPFGSHAADVAWEIGCFAVSVLGLAIRALTVGTAPRGTSGRNTRHQKAERLNTTGPYSLVRHPLYLGNYLIALGISLFSRAWFLPVILSLAALLYYERIASREEAFLEERFGETFRAWAAATPALLPRLSRWTPPALPFSARRAAAREFYAVAEIATAFFVLDVLEDLSVAGRVVFDPLWTTVAIAGGAFFVAMWLMKKAGRLGGTAHPAA